MAKLSIIIPDDVKEKLDKEAVKNDVKISWVVRKAIREYLEKREEE